MSPKAEFTGLSGAKERLGH